MFFNLFQNNDFEWIRKRLAVITFEECWSYGLNVSYESDANTILNHYLKIARAVKNKNAAGLGSLAYALSEGDNSVLRDEASNRPIRIIAEALKRPDDFWRWTNKQATGENVQILIRRAYQGFKMAGWPWDKAFAQAAAYLALTEGIPEIKTIPSSNTQDFPLWISIDKHTPQGKIAIRNAAKKIGINPDKALWLAFYFESAVCNQVEESFWWNREMAWRMRKLELNIEQGRNIWNDLAPVVQKGLIEEVEKLQRKIDSAQTEFNQKSFIQTDIF